MESFPLLQIPSLPISSLSDRLLDGQFFTVFPLLFLFLFLFHIYFLYLTVSAGFLFSFSTFVFLFSVFTISQEPYTFVDHFIAFFVPVFSGRVDGFHPDLLSVYRCIRLFVRQQIKYAGNIRKLRAVDCTCLTLSHHYVTLRHQSFPRSTMSRSGSFCCFYASEPKSLVHPWHI